jgi:hypothetical protein
LRKGPAGGGLGLHLRGNIEVFETAASRQKWLELHTDTHFASMYGNALGHPVREDLHVTHWRAIIGSLH